MCVICIIVFLFLLHHGKQNTPSFHTYKNGIREPQLAMRLPCGPSSFMSSGLLPLTCLLLSLFFPPAAFPHRLNLFYLANDVIQNCKRKNAIVFRDTFAEVLPEAAALVK